MSIKEDAQLTIERLILKAAMNEAAAAAMRMENEGPYLGFSEKDTQARKDEYQKKAEEYRAFFAQHPDFKEVGHIQALTLLIKMCDLKCVIPKNIC